jgi:hypothetical protein
MRDMYTVYDLGWISAGAVRKGVPVRLGLLWSADPGVTFVTARADRIPSTVSRTDHARELRSLVQAPFYETIEWLTLVGDSPDDFVDIELGYARFM